MTSTELATYQPEGLAIVADQTMFTSEQVKALQHIGVEDADEGDLRVFFHVCQRTGLDPFARQIHMIGRQSSVNVNGEWVKVTKQTIQTGIDGFRLIGRRAADHTHHSVSLSAPEWCHEDGGWRPVWRRAWGNPVAARVTIHRAGEPFTAVALFDEYAQTKRNGDLTSMWAQRPAGQLAKCAEALAWRMAFPQDLSGIYSDEEMGQANNPEPQAAPAAQPDRLAALTQEPTVTVEQVPPEPTHPEPIHPDGSPLINTRSNLAKRLFASVGAEGIVKDQFHAFFSSALGREINSASDLTDADAEEMLDNMAGLAADFLAEQGEVKA